MSSREWPSAIPRDALTERLQDALGESLQLDRELGGGGTARVFVARDVALDRLVVVKAIITAWADDTSAVERFTREIRILARLQHPNIVPLLAAGGHDGLVWYSTPFIAGRSLRAALDERGTLSVSETMRLVRDIARGLAAAHRAGVIHRDVKPDNVVLSDGTALLIDFGLARAVESTPVAAQRTSGDATRLTLPAHVIGTLPYVAPEQLDGAAVAQTDLYALGCVAFELLAGAPPFACTTLSTAMAAHFFQRAPHLGARCPHAPPALSALIDRCLAKEPEERPATADEVADTLERLLAALHASDDIGDRTPSGAAMLPQSIAPSRADDPLLLILPFDVAAGSAPDSDAAALADGFTEELITTLGASAGMRVIGRAITASLRGRREDPRELAARLRVTGLITGSVRTAGNRVRISVELADPVLGTQQWTARYDRPLDDLFAVQDDVAREITIALAHALGREELAEVSGRAAVSTVPADAVRAWLTGRQLRRTRPRALSEALQCFDEALRRAPAFGRALAARAEVLLAAALARDSSFVTSAEPAAHAMRPHELLAHAEAAARAALDVAPGNVDALAVLGACALVGRWQWVEARQHIRRVLDHDEAHPIAVSMMLLMVTAAGGDLATRWVAGAPNHSDGGWYLADLPPLVEALRRASLREQTASRARTFLEHAVRRGALPTYEWARCLADAGDLDAAEDALLEAASNRDWAVLLASVDPALTALRARPGVRALLRTIWGFGETMPA